MCMERRAAGPVESRDRVDRQRITTGWYELPGTGGYEVHEGLITVYRDYFDLATILNKWPS